MNELYNYLGWTVFFLLPCLVFAISIGLYLFVIRIFYSINSIEFDETICRKVKRFYLLLSIIEFSAPFVGLLGTVCAFLGLLPSISQSIVDLNIKTLSENIKLAAPGWGSSGLGFITAMIAFWIRKLYPILIPSEISLDNVDINWIPGEKVKSLASRVIGSKIFTAENLKKSQKFILNSTEKKSIDYIELEPTEMLLGVDRHV